MIQQTIEQNRNVQGLEKGLAATSNRTPYSALEDYRNATQIALECLKLLGLDVPEEDLLQAKRLDAMASDLEEGSGKRMDVGYFMEIVAHKALSLIAQTREGFFYLPAPPSYCDAASGKNKGGDHMLVHVTPEGVEIIALVDVTTDRKSKKDMRSSMYGGFGKPIPVIALEFAGMEWPTENQQVETTTTFVRKTAREQMRQNQESTLFGAAEMVVGDVLVEIRRRVSRGCSKTRDCIREQRLPSNQTRELLEQLAIVENILGHSPISFRVAQ